MLSTLFNAYGHVKGAAVGGAGRRMPVIRIGFKAEGCDEIPWTT
jgi:hypothetical protein